MASLSRMRSTHGGRARFPLTAATSMILPSDSDSFSVSGTATVTSLTAPPETRGRMVLLYVASGVLTLTNSPGTTTAGQMDLGSLDPSNVELSSTDSIRLLLREDGTWVRVGMQVNN